MAVRGATHEVAADPDGGVRDSSPTLVDHLGSAHAHVHELGVVGDWILLQRLNGLVLALQDLLAIGLLGEYFEAGGRLPNSSAIDLIWCGPAPQHTPR